MAETRKICCLCSIVLCLCVAGSYYNCYTYLISKLYFTKEVTHSKQRLALEDGESLMWEGTSYFTLFNSVLINCKI